MAAPLQLRDLPDMFPVFPLEGALLLPQGHLPLNIFEPRYLAMVDDSLAQGRYLGMVQPDKRHALGHDVPGLYRIGCLGRITTFEATNDGRYLITLTGVIRFSIIEDVPGPQPYRRVRAGVSAFAEDLTPVKSSILPFPRQDLLAALTRYFISVGVEANWNTIDQMEDNDLLTALCMACPFTNEEKQALLEAKTPLLRAETLRALLEIHAFDGGPDNLPSSSIN